jgi:hypothetical protein
MRRNIAGRAAASQTTLIPGWRDILLSSAAFAKVADLAR